MLSKTIIGVVSDVRGRTVAEAPVPVVFIPHAQHPDVLRPSLVIRSSLPFASIAAAVRQRLADLDSQLLILRIRPMDEVVSTALSRPRFNRAPVVVVRHRGAGPRVGRHLRRFLPTW